MANDGTSNKNDVAIQTSLLAADTMLRKVNTNGARGVKKLGVVRSAVATATPENAAELLSQVTIDLDEARSAFEDATNAATQVQQFLSGLVVKNSKP